VPLDVSSEDSIKALTSHLPPSIPIDILVNNAGALVNVDLNSATSKVMLDTYMVNAVAPLLVTQTLLGNLKEGAKKNPGKTMIINVTSRMGSIADNTSGKSYAYR